MPGLLERESRSIGPMETKFALGIDIIEIGRIADVIARHGDRFLQRVYTADEIAFCRGRIPELAARFAAKEAVMKALGTGVRGVGWREIEVLPNRRGKPLVFLYGRAEARAAAIGLRGLEVSLTHSREYAMAVAVGERWLTADEDTPRFGERARKLVEERGVR
ncbi:Holo-[acyl-carrier-protein] synthase [bacterium HR29]|nr:Holo-[acyl-carrier-protein] synthase [bacterium HR29]